MATYDTLYNSLFPTIFLLFRMARKAPGLVKYTSQHGNLTHQKEISVQGREILLDSSYQKLRPTLQRALRCSLILSPPIQALTCWFHLSPPLYIDKHNINQGRLKGYRKQLRKFNHKGNHTIGCYPKYLLVFTEYQVQGWWTMIISTVKSLPYGRNFIEILLTSSWHAHLKHSMPYTFILKK